MQKRVLLIGYNFSPEPTGIGKYNGEMIQWLAAKGYDCSVVTTYPYYPFWKVQAPYVKQRFWYQTEKESFPSGGNITIYRCPMYVPSLPTGKKRIILDISFFISSFFRLISLMFQSRFDHVIAVAPSFNFGLLGFFVQKIHGAKFSYHIQDLQIEAARDLNMVKSDFFIKMLLAVERFILNKADYVSSISPSMIAKINSKSKKPIYLFPNWVNTDFFRPLSEKDKIKQEFGYSPEDKIVLYSGSIGEKQGLDQIINTGHSLKHIKNLHFLICGSGPFLDKLMKLKIELKLENVRFLPLQPLFKFVKILNMADVHLVIQKFSTSDLMLPSKLTSIWAVGGVPLVTTMPGSQLYRTINNFKIGIIIDRDDQEALNQGIKNAIEQSWNEISINSRRYAEDHLSINGIMDRFENQILKGEFQREMVNGLVSQNEFAKG